MTWKDADISQKHQAKWLLLFFASLMMHFLGFLGVNRISVMEDSKPRSVKVTLKEKPKIESTPSPKKTKVEPYRPQTPSLKHDIRPVPDKIVQGLSKDSLAGEGRIAVPLGNSLAVPDEGVRVQTIDANTSDLTSGAKLISETLLTPAYTEEAIDAGVEGTFIVDVFVQADGYVREAELRKRINYGMDRRVVEAVLKAKFIPRKNKFGVAEEGWTELKFKLVIP